MMIVDLLVTLLVICVLTFGYEARSFWIYFVALWIAVGIIIALHLLVDLVTGNFFKRLMGQMSFNLASRRRIMRSKVVCNPDEERLDKLDEDGLRTHIENHPEDALACEILCERLRAVRKWSEFARECEYLLTLKDSDTSVEERCRLYHELADLYLGELNRPERAEQALQAVVAKYPKHYQSTLARRRLEDLHADRDRRRRLGVEDPGRPNF